MKTQRSVNVLSVGLMLGLAGSLSLNLYQLNERNRRDSLPLPGLAPMAGVGAAAMADDLTTYQRQNACKDSLIFKLQHTHSSHHVATN